MEEKISYQNQGKGLNIFEKYLTLWVVLCIAGGIILGKVACGAGDGCRRADRGAGNADAGANMPENPEMVSGRANKYGFAC